MRDQLVEIQVPDLSAIQKRLKGMQHKAPNIMARSINRTITHVSKLMANEARRTYIVKDGAVRKTLKIRKARVGNISGEVISRSNKKVRLIGFKVSPANPRPSSPPIFYKSKVKQAGGLKALPGSGDRSSAFVAKMKSGHKGVFQRQAHDRRSNPRKGHPNDQPIAELFGMSVPSMFATKDISTEIIDQGKVFMHKALDEEIKRALEMGR